MPLTRELHIIRAHHLHYQSLLDDFSKHIHFIRDTHNPALEHLSEADRSFNKRIMDRECANLLSESKRLTAELHMQERRLKNVMGLVFSSVNITDSRYMRQMTEAAVRDSAAMKQIAYLSMVFLPASFVAGVFGMNVSEINPGTLGTMARYVEIALPLTIATIWIVIAFQSKYIFPQNATMDVGSPTFQSLSLTSSTRKRPRDDRSRRHAAPSAPWPWVDLEDGAYVLRNPIGLFSANLALAEIDRERLDCLLPPIPPLCDHKDCGGCWKGYPQSRFPNWTKQQVIKSGLYSAIWDYAKDRNCLCHRVAVDSNGLFTNPGTIIARHGEEDTIWDELIHENQTPEGTRVQVLFVENLSGPVLQMLGAKYNIEPFFWSSSLNWIPSHFQEEVQPGIGDHITITLTFLRSTSDHEAVQMDNPFAKSTGVQNIDPRCPLRLHSNNRILAMDFLAVHVVRNINGSTILSFHPSSNFLTTTAPLQHERILSAGQSVHWQSVFQKSVDSTFVLLTFVWQAIYAWDEALENLSDHISFLERWISVITAEITLIQRVHIIRAHILYYESLLDDFAKHIIFIRDTHNPALDCLSKSDLKFNRGVMNRECANLLSETERFRTELHTQDRLLRSIVALEFSVPTGIGSRHMRQITEAAAQNRAAIKGTAYLLIIYLPASFVAHVFALNVRELNPGTAGTMVDYIKVALPLTLATLWIVVVCQGRYIFPEDTSFLKRLAWPVYLLIQMLRKRQQGEELGEAEPPSNICR
ncbi:hypothetical protein CVT26_014746 [Gymnopilus dilepis]|uniref:Uncharacterized protein n=1 Tax=Gymnopilus dilepis TaxID=231916 RepID=A0A409WR24_9AGAR|nr:hypothetical protein CVT26_014746 [Gymnopilus dilepis]